MKKIFKISRYFLFIIFASMLSFFGANKISPDKNSGSTSQSSPILPTAYADTPSGGGPSDCDGGPGCDGP